VEVLFQLSAIKLLKLKSVLPHPTYKSLCDCSTQYVICVLSTLSTGLSCMSFSPLQCTKQLVLRTLRGQICTSEQFYTVKSFGLPVQNFWRCRIVCWYRFVRVRFTKPVVLCMQWEKWHAGQARAKCRQHTNHVLSAAIAQAFVLRMRKNRFQLWELHWRKLRWYLNHW